ncbi:MAG: PAS domain S-box protein [Labilithrix sp.]|nr:PAS domain S-box protein [Labilithrix sp.]
MTSNTQHLHSPVGVISGVDDEITSADDTFLQMLGYSREEFERDGLDWRKLTPPQYAVRDDAQMRRALESLSSGGFTEPYQKAFIRKDGTLVPVLALGAYVDGSKSAWLGYVVDLSSPPGLASPPEPVARIGQPRPEEFYARLLRELVRERTRMVAMLDNTHALIWGVDNEGRLLAANAAFQAAQRIVTGRDVSVGETLLGPPHLPPEVVEVWRSGLAQALAGERVSKRGILATPERQLHFDSVFSPIVDHQQGVAGVAVVAHDVSERVQVEDALRKSEARFRTLAAASPTGVFLTDATGSVLYVNPRIARIWAMDPEEMFGRGWTRRIHPDDRDRVERETQLDAPEDRDYEQEYRLLLPDGSERHVHAWIAPVREGASITGFVGCVQDETERHAVALQTRQREKMESLGRLAGGIAHDFNNMLAVVFSHVESAMEETRPDASLRSSLEEILVAARRARDLVRQILTFSRRSDRSLALVDLRAVVLEGLRLLRSTLPATIALATKTPSVPVVVRGDATGLQQILVNLCTNSARAMSNRGTISVRLDAVGCPPDGNAVLTVSDTGCGMTPKVQARIFEPFFTTSSVGQGTGMGLAVVHGVVTAHGGTIDVSSAPKKGATFRVSIPLVRGVVNKSAPPPPSPSVARKGRVLLVEDDRGVAHGATALLKRSGYDVTHAANGIEALRVFSAAPAAIDVVLSDLAMPDLAGDKLAQTIHIVRPSLPIVLMTGFSELLNTDDLRDLGVIATLAKPWTSNELLTCIQEALEGVPETEGDGCADPGEAPRDDPSS